MSLKLYQYFMHDATILEVQLNFVKKEIQFYVENFIEVDNDYQQTRIIFQNISKLVFNNLDFLQNVIPNIGLDLLSFDVKMSNYLTQISMILHVGFGKPDLSISFIINHESFIIED